MISKVVFFVAALAAVNATALLHGAALASTGISSVSRHQDGLGNFAFRSDIISGGASRSHAEVGSTVAKVVAAPTFFAAPALLSAPIAPAIVGAHAAPALLSAPIAPAFVGAHAAPSFLSAPIAPAVFGAHAAPALLSAPIAPGILSGHGAVTAYGSPLGLGLRSGIFGLNAGKYIL